METKVCNKCGQERPIDKFALGKGLTRRNICNYCLMEQEKARANKNRAFWLEMDWIFKPETRNG